jgi:hypothetical protein
MYAYQESMGTEDCVVVLDDGSTDDTLQVCKIYSNNIDVFYFKLTDKQPGVWRDSAAFLNMGISFAIHALGAERVIPTHPEIVPGIYTFDAINAAQEGIDFVMFRGYYLPVELQLRYEDWFFLLMDDRSKGGTADWSIQRFKAICPDFYDYGDSNHDFHPNNLEADNRPFDSWIFCSATTDTWKRFKGMPESSNWGTVDMAFMKQRYTFGFTTATPNEVDTWVLHENHDDPKYNVLTPRVAEVWVEDMKANHDQYTTIESKPDYLNPNRWKP